MLVYSENAQKAIEGNGGAGIGVCILIPMRDPEAVQTLVGCMERIGIEPNDRNLANLLEQLLGRGDLVRSEAEIFREWVEKREASA